MRRRLDPDERRAELLDFGRHHFANEAFDARSIDDIAESAGVSKGTLYKYFGGRRGFYVATIESVVEGLLAELSSVAEVTASDRPRQLVAAFVRYAQSHRGIYLALVNGGLGADEELSPLLERVRVAASHLVLEAFSRPEADPLTRLAIFGWVAAVEATTARWLTAKTVTQDELVKMLTHRLQRLMEDS